MKVQLSPWQKEVATDPHRFRVVCAGRRSGKSYLAQRIVLKWAVESPGLYWIVSPTYKQSKQIHWRELQSAIPRQWVVKKNEVDLSITLANGAVIELKGAENPDALRGIKLKGLVIDEIASIRNWDWLWSEVLRPTLTDYAAPALFISTPKGYNHFHDLFQMGLADTSDDTGRADYRSWRFTSYDNPHVQASEIDQARRELTEDTFAQEYMADFRNAVGLAFKPFDRNIHIIEPFAIPETWARARGFDYGSAHPTGSVRVAFDPEDTAFIDHSYKDRRQSIEDHARAILAQDYSLGVIPAWGDPSGAQWFTEFGKHNLHIQPANKQIGQGARGWVEWTVEAVNQRLKPVPGHTVRLPDGREITDAPRLFILNTPENQALIREMERLKWKETAVGVTLPLLDEDDDPEGHYDLVAALRYLIVSYTAGLAKRGDYRTYVARVHNTTYDQDLGI